MMSKWLGGAALGLVLLVGNTSGAAPESAVRAKPAAPTPPDLADFPSKMRSFPLYGDAAIPNSKPAPDEESTTDGSWI